MKKDAKKDIKNESENKSEKKKQIKVQLPDGDVVPVIDDPESVTLRRKRNDFSAAEDELLLFGYAISCHLIGVGKPGFWFPITKLFANSERPIPRELCRRRFVTILRNPQTYERCKNLVADFKRLYDRALVTKEFDTQEGNNLKDFDYFPMIDYLKSLTLMPETQVEVEGNVVELPDTIDELLRDFVITPLSTELHVAVGLHSRDSIRRKVALLYSLPLLIDDRADDLEQDTEEDFKESLVQGFIKVISFSLR